MLLTYRARVRVVGSRSNGLASLAVTHVGGRHRRAQEAAVWRRHSAPIAAQFKGGPIMRRESASLQDCFLDELISPYPRATVKLACGAFQISTPTAGYLVKG
jgi:hypothetical protein